MATKAQKLSFQDASFLRLESAARPFHVAGLMLFSPPEKAGKNYLRQLVQKCGRLNELWPVFDQKLKDPESLRNAAWIEADDYDPAYHVQHYALPAPGRLEDLLTLVSRAHERVLDRNRPLWELHVIEGLQGDRFAIYCKVHHALVDGVGALRMIDALFSDSAGKRVDFKKAEVLAREHHEKYQPLRQLGRAGAELRRHSRALPQVYTHLASMGRDALLGRKDAPPLPFTAPHTVFNTDIDARREIILSQLPLKQLRTLATRSGGTLNEVLIAVCGGALRAYLLEQGELPRETLEAGIPMSIKRDGEEAGNQVCFMISPFFTNERDPWRRLKRVIKVSQQAKKDVRDMSRTAAQDFTNALMMPTILLTLTGNAGKVRPALNCIVSNVPGSAKPLYLDGAELESLYPLSVVTDGIAINITVVSYQNTLCVAITSCPTLLPDIGGLGKLIQGSFKELKQAEREQRK